MDDIRHMVLLLVLSIMAVAGLTCAHAERPGSGPGLEEPMVHCSRNGGQWVVEYDLHGNITRHACIYGRQGG